MALKSEVVLSDVHTTGLESSTGDESANMLP